MSKLMEQVQKDVSQAELREFMGYMKGAGDITELFDKAEGENHSKEDKDKARTAIFKRGITKGKAVKGIDLPAEESNPQHYQAAKGYASLEQQELNERASNVFSKNLETIAKQVDDSKIKKIPLDDRFAKYAGNEYAEWRQLYRGVEQANEIKSRANNEERLSKEEQQVLVGAFTNKAAEEAKASAEKDGFSKDLQDARAKLAQIAIQAGLRKVDYKLGAGEYQKAAEEALRKYEGENKGRNLRGYFVKTVEGLAKENQGQAMGLVYELAK